MKIRLIIIFLASLALVTTVAGGSLYYYSMRNNAVLDLHKETDGEIKDIADRIELSIAEHQKIAASLAGLKGIRMVLENRQESARSDANALLDHFQRSFSVDVCYLIDSSGTTIASSNRRAPDSFIGRNYSFRPYFLSALAGDSGVYMALGVTSGKRGVYYSHPVFREGTRTSIGSLVVKTSVEPIEKEISKRRDGVMMLVGPRETLFASSRPEWLLHVLWQLPDEALAAITETRQFGKGPLKWTGMKRIGDLRAVDPAGGEYLIHEAPIENYPGWKIIFLHDLRAVSRQLTGKVFQGFGTIMALICLIIGAVSVVLYRKASTEIIKRKQAEDELKSSNDLLQTMIKASPLPITAIDAQGRTILWNAAAERVFGWSGQEVIGLPSRIVPHDLQKEHISFRNKIVDDDTITGVETRRMKKDGTLIDVTVSSATIKDDHGTGVAAMGIYEDITERKKAEDEVRFLAAIIQSLPEAVCAVNREGITISWNAGAERMLGYKASEIIGKSITMVIPEDIAAKEFDHCLAILNKEGQFTGYESLRLARDGRIVPVEITAVAITDSSGDISSYASIMADITERKRIEAERLKSHMLESIGILAGGIAHDFNNLLAALLGNIYIAKNALSPDDKAFNRLTDAEGVCELASELSRRLITFSTGGDPIRKIRPLSPIIEHAVATGLKGSPITAELMLADDLLDAAIDEGQMKQVFINLVKNASEAMPRGGTLSIHAKNIHVAAEDPGPMKSGDYLKISVRDTGAGIPSEKYAKIFDPYFTTKDTYSQKGLGLGLAVCYSVIKRHDGLITVDSTVGEGTTFTIVLPAVSSGLEPQAKKKHN